jgi:hypothetical protein
MKWVVLALVSSLAVAALIGATSSPISASRTTTTAIVGYQVTPDGTWTDPSTLEVHRSYNVAITFSHRGQTLAQVIAHAGDGAWGDSIHHRYAGNGTDTFSASVVGGLVGQPVYFELLLSQYVGHGAHQSLQPVDILTVGPYTN